MEHVNHLDLKVKSPLGYIVLELAVNFLVAKGKREMGTQSVFC